ncbi:MAG: argininosuccinate lyase [Chloroflexota bacterium]|nr:argininosuccinate lyase [Chloroflexota bacterium]
MTLWNGRFSTKLDGQAWALNASLGFDRRLADQDVRGSIAWAAALHNAGVLTDKDYHLIVEGLQVILKEFQGKKFTFLEDDEDIHTAVERRLGELIGATAGKLHTGRSRNDQVATDLRLWVLDFLPLVDQAIRGLQSVLLELAEDHITTLMPGYTHLQRAQPVTLAHWLLSHFWPLQRDRERLSDLRDRVSICPLGSGALAGTAFPIDRHSLASSLGFDAPGLNSMDCVSDRDFVAEYLFCCSLCGVHLSKLSENMILFTTAEFGFIELNEAYATGSSLMPQKKNPDLFELARGKSGTMIGLLTGFMATLKGLPSTYDKDLQEDKVPVFQATDTLLAVVPVLAGALHTMSVNEERMLAAIDASMLATDLADYLVRRGMPFREAHGVTGKAVRLALQKGVDLDQLSLSEWQTLGPFEADVVQVFDVQKSVERRNAIGGTSPEAVKDQIAGALRLLTSQDHTIQKDQSLETLNPKSNAKGD